jgi:hypothetical protein
MVQTNIKHKKQTLLADDPTKDVSASEWNEGHDITGDIDFGGFLAKELGIEGKDFDASPVANRRLKVIDGLWKALTTADIEGRYISKASIEQLLKADISDFAHKGTHVSGGSDGFAKGDILQAAARYLEDIADPASDSKRLWLVDGASDIKYWDDQVTPVKQTVERQANKNTANGYAGLDGSSKIINSQIAEVLALGDLIDVVNSLSLARGDLLYRDASALNRLAIGSAGRRLESDGTDPVWKVTDYSCRVYRTTNQSISNDTATYVAFDNESYDTDTMHDNSTNNDRITIKTAGKYTICGAVLFAANSTGIRILEIEKNGTTTLASSRINATASPYYTGLMAVSSDNFAVNDYVKALVLQNSGGALNLVVQGGIPNFSAQKNDRGG